MATASGVGGGSCGLAATAGPPRAYCGMPPAVDRAITEVADEVFFTSLPVGYEREEDVSLDASAADADKEHEEELQGEGGQLLSAPANRARTRCS